MIENNEKETVRSVERRRFLEIAGKAGFTAAVVAGAAGCCVRLSGLSFCCACTGVVTAGALATWTGASGFLRGTTDGTGAAGSLAVGSGATSAPVTIAGVSG